MLKKTKGFTLAEILGVIVIISLLLILIIPTILNQINSTKENAENAGNELIFSAAEQHIKENSNKYPPDKSGRYCISIQELIDEGKLVAPVKDVTTGKDISDKSVMVTIYSSGNTEYELKDTDDCKTVANLPMIDFIVTPHGSSWVQKRTAKIIWPAISGEYKARYRIDNGSWVYVDSIDNKIGGNIEIDFTETSYSKLLEAQYIGKGEETTTNNIITSKINIVNVDSTPPECELMTTGTIGDNSWFTSNVKVSFKSKTDEISGVAKSGISLSSSYSFGNQSMTQTKDTAGITYYGFVEDMAGNQNKCQISFKKDGTKPSCSLTDSGTKGDNNWYRSNVSIKMSEYSDNLSGVSTYGMSTNSGATYNKTTQMILSSDTKGQNYYGFVKDNAGNTTTCTTSVKRDVTPPICSIKDSGTKGDNNWYRSNVNVKLTTSDATSEVSVYGMNAGGGTTYNGTSNMTQSSDIAGITYSGYVKDNAGNTSSCSTSFKKDSTPPSCTSSKGNLWTTSGVTITYSCGDNLSNVAFCPANKSGQKSSVGEETVRDNAGNTATCPGQTVNSQVQYRTSTRDTLTCTSSACCGSYSYSYKCQKYYCAPFVDDTGCEFQSQGGKCCGWISSTCYGTASYTCKNSCCGYSSWSAWSSWGSGSPCNTTTCRSESRTLYY